MNDFLGDEIGDVNRFRWAVAEQILQAGLDAMYFDLDTIWFGDLRQVYGQSDFDVLFQSQANAPGEETDFESTPSIAAWRAHAKEHDEDACCAVGWSRACTGVMLLRA